MSFKNINLGDVKLKPRFEDDSEISSGAASNYEFPLSKNAVAGFILSILYIFTGPLGTYYLFYDGRRVEPLLVILSVTSFICFFGGLILSLRGRSECKYQCFEGKGFGSAGFAITLITLGIVVLMLFSLSITKSMMGEYHGPEVMIGNLKVVLNRDERTAKKALASKWYWDGDVNNLVMEVPDEYSDGIVIDKIGQEHRGPRSRVFEFCIRDDMKEKIKDDYHENVPAGTAVHYEDLIITVVIGKNVEYVNIYDLPTWVRKNDDGSVTKYWLHLRFEVSPENKDFYAKDGKLYNAHTRQLYSGIDESFYPDETSSENESGS